MELDGSTYAIVNTPDRDTTAARKGQASVDNSGVVGSLLVELLGVAWEGHADIELGNGDLSTGIVELLKSTGNGTDGTVANDQVRLLLHNQYDIHK